MRVLHTSDWHLGNSFHERKRTQEFESFLNWLLKPMETDRIDLLLVSGDIFDNGTPGTQALELYFNFLGRIAENGCRHVVITAGNHDSPSLLNAPREVFRNLNIHVIGSVTSDPADEVLVLRDESGEPLIIICAVPFLRDRDVRNVTAGENFEEKAGKLSSGIRDHYKRVQEIALSCRDTIGKPIPIVVMGHLFATGSLLTEDDKNREQYVGTLAGVGPEIFDPQMDYLALGHLHRAQRVNGQESWRYSGAPLPMEFSNTPRQKKVVIIEFGPGSKTICEVPIPCFQEMERVRGSFAEIETRIQEVVFSGKPIWIEAVLDEPAIIPDFQEKLHRMTRGTNVDILGTVSTRLDPHLLETEAPEETLDGLSEREVFIRCLDANNVDDMEMPELIALFCDVLNELRLNETTGDRG